MLDEISGLSNLSVYTSQGIHLGAVENLILDITNSKIDGLYIGSTNPNLVEGGVSVNLPYRWVQSVGEIIILRYFPGKITPKKEKEEEKSAEEKIE